MVTKAVKSGVSPRKGTAMGMYDKGSSKGARGVKRGPGKPPPGRGPRSSRGY